MILSFLIKLILFAVAAYVAILALLYFLQEKLIFPAPNLVVPNDQVGSFKQVSINTSDGEILLAYHHKGDVGKPTILLFHGNGDVAINLMSRGEAFAELGYGVLLAGYRGYGGSTGFPTEQGLYTDALAAYDFIRAQSEGPIGIYAHSLGAGVGLKLSTQRDIFALVLESPFDSLQAVAAARMPWIPMKLLLKHKFRSDLIIGTIQAPILIIHGDADGVVPIAHGKQLLKHAPQGTEFITIEGAGHNDLAQFRTIEKAVQFMVRVSSIGAGE